MNISPQYRTLGAFTGEPEKPEKTGATEPAHTPLPWRFVPWHVEEDMSAVRAPDGHLICSTASDANAQIIVTAVNAYASNTAELRAAYERVAQLEAVLGECQDYFEERADADCDQDGFIPNEEMRMLNIVDEVLP